MGRIRAAAMIWRFALLSLLLHGLLAALPAAQSRQRLLWPAPELSVNLQAGPAARSAPAATTLPASNHRPSVAPVLTALTPVHPAPSLAPAAPPPDSSREANRPVQEHQLINHLQSLLRTELQTHFVYPPLAVRQGWQGRVQVAMQIEADGRLSELQVLRSSGYAVLDADAVQTLQRIGRLPQARAWLSGRARWVEIPVEYRLLEG